jgi:hypothetical protein
MDNGVKKPWLSKTIWLNFLAGVVVASLPFFPQLQGIADWLKDSSNLALIGVGWSAVNIGLRFLTKDKVQLVD